MRSSRGRPLAGLYVSLARSEPREGRLGEACVGQRFSGIKKLGEKAFAFQSRSLGPETSPPLFDVGYLSHAEAATRTLRRAVRRYGKLSLAMQMTAMITKEGELYVAQCLDVDVASQGATVDEALANLREALELRFEDEDVPEDVPTAVVRPFEVNVRRAS
jgi:predicted RNase H-like HicB family nuclease